VVEERELNGASEVSDMHGKAARAAENEAGAERMKTETRTAERRS